MTYQKGDVIYYEDKGGSKFVGLILDPHNSRGFLTVLWRDHIRQYVYDEADFSLSHVITLGNISDVTSEHPEVTVYG